MTANVKNIIKNLKGRFYIAHGILAMLCCISFSAFAQSLPAESESEPAPTFHIPEFKPQTSALGTDAENTTSSSESEEEENTSNALSSRCSSTGCAKMYPEDNISQLHHKYESAGNPCAFNNCLAGDIGGCSYGSSQLACGSGSMKTFLKTLQSTNPTIWNQLGGGSVDSMNARACSAPATDFASKWKGVCSTDSSAAAFENAQEQYMQKMYYDVAANAILKEYGIDFNNRSPELQMALFSAAVALGSPAGAKNLLKSVKNNIGDPAQMTDAELLEAMYTRRDYFYGSSSEAVRASVQRRNAREGSEALESLKIREAWEAEQQKPKSEQKTYEEIVKEVTGKEACSGSQSGNFNCDASGASGGPGTGSSSSGSSGDSNSGDSIYSNKNCSPSQYKIGYGSCMMCPLFAVIFNTASYIAKLSFDTLAMPVFSVVLVAWAIWIAFQILMFVSSFKTKDAPTLIKTLLNKSFVVLIVVLFLQADSGSFMAMLMDPIFSTGFKLAQMASSDEACSIEQYALMKDGGLSVSMGESILCALQAIQKKLLDALSLGVSSMCLAFYVKGKLFIFPSLGYLFSGFLIFGGAGIVIIIFPFLLIDSIFQLTVAAALLPAAIGAYAFKLTQKYSKKVWDIFMNAIFNFVFMSLVIYILVGSIENTLSQSPVGKLDDSSYQEAILTTLVWGGVTLIKILFILLLTWVILEEVNSYASQFAPSVVPGGAGRSIGGMAAKGTKDLGLKAVQGAKTVGKAVGENIKEKAGDMRRNAQMKNIQKHGQKQDITDEKGNVIGHTYTIENKSWLKGRKKTKTVTVMNNGTKMLESSKDYGNGKVVTTRSDGYLKQVQVTQKDEKTGEIKVVSSSVEIQTAGLKAAREPDGSLNRVSMELALKNSAFSEKMIKAAVVQQYAKQSGMQIPQNVTEDNIKISKDKNGREIVEILQKGENGNSNILRMQMPTADKPNRVMLESIQKDKEGNEVTLATDGMVNKRQHKRFNKEKGQWESSEHYAMSEYYAQRSKYGVDIDGDLSQIFEKHGGLAYSPEEQEKIRKAFVKHRQKSKTASIHGLI